MERRDFLKAGLVLGGAAALGGCRLFPIPPSPGARTHSIIDGAPGDSGIDTIVICMMENRSFDSYLGWLARDDKYLETGRKRYGNGFTVQRRVQFQTYPDPNGNRGRYVPPRPVPGRRIRGGAATSAIPGTDGHTGRAQRDGGFLAPGSRQRPARARRTSRARTSRSTTRSRAASSCSTTGTRRCSGRPYPNRQYLLSAQSGGNKINNVPDRIPDAVSNGTTIVDRLTRARRLRRRLLQRPPAARAVRPAHAAVLSTRSPTTSRTPKPGGSPNVTFVIRASSPRRSQRRPPARRPARGAAVRARRVLRVRAVAALGARAVRAHLRRVGRVLRPRRAAGTSRTIARTRSTPTTSVRPASVCRRSSRRRVRCPAPSTTALYDHTAVAAVPRMAVPRCAATRIERSARAGR